MAETGMCSVDCGGETEADSVTQVEVNSNEETCDQDESTNDPEPTTNYDSSDGAVHRCYRCDYESTSQSSLMLHMATCNDSRKIFECDVCQMKFSNGANMRRHKMRHTGVKPYECRICQKRFFRKDHLVEHFTTHTKTLPFHCPICNRGFQRQIAMRAHFQNEHVGQSEMIKSCPLCSYRATSMKSLRVHFYNRHGIDLDRPGTGGDLQSVSNGVSSGGGGAGSDSGDSGRSADNATPPMHFLTPHVEISMTEPPQTFSPPPTKPLGSSGNEECGVMNGDSPGSPQSGDSNAPSSSNHNGSQSDSTSMTPSVSLIPIKQEVESPEDQPKRPSSVVNSLAKDQSALSALIKVSPLKSLLRDDLRSRPTEAGSSSDVPNPDSVWRPATTMNCTPKQRLHCVFCGISFPDQTLYFLHKGCHSDSNPWKCNICGEQCCNLYDFNSHLLSKAHQ